MYDGAEVTANGRAAFLNKFLDEVDPDRQLPEAERERRALAARRAHFATLAYRSAVARSKKASASLKADAQEVRDALASTTTSASTR